MLITLVQVSVDRSISLDFRQNLHRLILSHKVKPSFLGQLVFSGVQTLPDGASTHSISTMLVILQIQLVEWLVLAFVFLWSI